MVASSHIEIGATSEKQLVDGAITTLRQRTNWAGNITAAPRIAVTPGSLGELRAVVIEAARRGETVRVAGAGHSFRALYVTNGTC